MIAITMLCKNEPCAVADEENHEKARVRNDI